MVTITARYILGKKNVLTDELSHPDLVLPTSWSLLPWVFGAICEVHGCPHVGLFATRVNTKLPLYMSTVQDPMACNQDAFQHW